MGLTREEPIFAALEPSYNTPAVPVGADAIQTSDIPSFDPMANATFSERSIVRANTIAKPAALFGGAAPSLTVVVELKGSSAPGVAPEWGRLLRACGFVETIVPATSVTYTPRVAGTTYDSLTIYHWQAGTRYILTGARGTVVMRGTVGEVPVLEFTFAARMVVGSHSAVAQPVPVYDGVVPYRFNASNFLTLNPGAFNPSFTEFGFDMRNTVAIGKNANSADGFGEIRITDRQLGVTLNPEQTDVATKDWLSEVQQATPQSLAMVLGAVGGNRVSVNMPQLVPAEHAYADRDGVRTIDYGYTGEETASLNDEISLVID